jgi:hypothetical protein
MIVMTDSAQRNEVVLLEDDRSSVEQDHDDKVNVDRRYRYTVAAAAAVAKNKKQPCTLTLSSNKKAKALSFSKYPCPWAAVTCMALRVLQVLELETKATISTQQ